VKWPRRETDHSPPAVPRLRMRGAKPPLPATQLTYLYVVHLAPLPVAHYTGGVENGRIVSKQ
jgi:hypothetical protein